MSTALVPIGEMNTYLRRYRAALDRENSNAHRHVFWSRPLQKWIIVRRRGDQAEFEFSDECPCDSDD